MSRVAALSLTGLLTGLLLGGCGGDGGTRFGHADDVQAWRTAMNPLVVEVSAIEREVGERTLDENNVAIDADIAPVYEELRPRLVAVQQQLVSIRPPRKLRALHDQISDLVQLRLEAYELVIDGFANGDVSLYDDAVARLAAANALIADVNLGLCEVDVALDDRNDCRLLAGLQWSAGSVHASHRHGAGATS